MKSILFSLIFLLNIEMLEILLIVDNIHNCVICIDDGIAVVAYSKKDYISECIFCILYCIIVGLRLCK